VQVLDDIDREILEILQNDFPLSVQPFGDIADRLHLQEDEILDRIKTMKDRGLIRRIGAVMDSRNMGFNSTLCAIKVPEARIDEVANLINQLPGVTHNYLRDHEYNLWFTLTMPSLEDVSAQLNELESLVGLKIINLPAKKVYKIKVSFDMGNSHEV